MSLAKDLIVFLFLPREMRRTGEQLLGHLPLSRLNRSLSRRGQSRKWKAILFSTNRRLEILEAGRREAMREG